jgi:regulator of protease activity HflC (stomatin/prohibitin superfamily)
MIQALYDAFLAPGDYGLPRILLMPQFWIGFGIFCFFVISGFRIAQQYERALVFRFGAYKRTSGPGLFWIIPFGIEYARKVDIRVLTDGIEKQEAMTRDSVPIQLNAVIWYRIVKPDLAVIEVQDVRDAVIQVALTTLRNVIGSHPLDDVLKEREKMAELIKVRVDQVTEAWGVEVQNVEMKNIEIPQSMQRAMAQEAEALREKRARVIKASAEFEAAKLLQEAGHEIMRTPASLELRRMQMLTEIGAEQNTMTVVMMPSEFVEAAKAIGSMVSTPKPISIPAAPESKAKPDDSLGWP